MTSAPQTPPATPEGRKSSRWYIPAFDGLRGVLAVAVMWVHAGFPGNVLWLAVPVFFVMSGFFITKILLMHPPEGKLAGVRAFVRNRALRLGPVYVVFVAFLTGLAVIGHPESVRADLPWLWTLTYDFRLISEGWDADLYKHVWSIGVEAQLCALMAVAALVLSRRGLRNFLVTLAVGGPLIRLVAGLIMIGPGGLSYPYMIDVLQGLPFGYVDAFAMGGLLAFPELFARLPPTRRLWLGLLALIAAISAVEVLAAWRTGAAFPLWKAWAISFPIDYGWLWGYSLLGLFSVVLIVTITRRARVLTRVLENRALIWLGERSYSLYLLHMSVFYVGHRLAGWNPTPWQELAILVGCGPVAVGLAALSFRFIELPFLRRKSRRPIPSVPAASPA